MHIKHLKIATFRNITQADIRVDDAQVIALHGPNGAGKTNLLEALSLLSPGKGLHHAKREEQIQNDMPQWGVHATLKQNEMEHTVGMSYTRASPRQIKINGTPAEKQTALTQLGNVLWFTPRMDRLFADGAATRRDFFDRLTFGMFPDHAATLNKYRHHLRSRVKLLKQNAATDWIMVEEEQAAACAVRLIEARQLYLQKLSAHLPEVSLTLHGKAEQLVEETLEPEQVLQQKFYATRERDALIGTTSFGPHRTEVSGLLFPENIPLCQTSTGQHKRTLLYILLANARLAHSETGYPPLLLLDEITAHLDQEIKQILFTELTKLGTQIWMTGTEKALFAGLPDPVFIEAKQGIFTSKPA